MASFLCQVQTIQRSAGRSAVAAAAYRSGACLVDDRLAMEFDFAAKDGVEHTEIMAPAAAPPGLSEREALWNAAEKMEARKDAVPARELLLALPHELDFQQRHELVREFVKEHLVARGMIADVAMHTPGKQGDERNFHAHIMVTTRAVGPKGFGRKPPEWWSPKMVREWRAGWAKIQNEHLRRRLGPDAPQVSHLSLVERGVDRAPTVHLGPSATALERKNIASERGAQNRDVKARNTKAREIRLDFQDTADRIAVAAPMISVPLSKLVTEAGKVRDRMVAERDGWAAERAALVAPKIPSAPQIERELTGEAARARALAKARLARTEGRVKAVRSKRLQLVQWVRNPARMIWAKHAELNAIARARAELRRTELGVRVRQEWARSPQGQAFIAARRQPGLERAANVARQRRTLERKIKRADKRIVTATRTFNDLRSPRNSARACSAYPRNLPTRPASSATSGRQPARRCSGFHCRRDSRPSSASTEAWAGSSAVVSSPVSERRMVLMTAAKRLSIVLPLAGVTILLALAIATQHVASAFHFPRAFGQGLIDLGNTRIYPPWAFVGWYVRFAHSYQQTFDLAAMIALAVALLPAMMAIGLTRGAQRQPRKFGQDAWAHLADVQRAKLVAPSREISGRVLGRFAGRYLTYSGIEHAIIVGASRSGKGVGHVVPTLIAWPHSTFVYDRKGELWHITADHRKRFSHVFYFSPTDPNTVRWNPLFEVRKGAMEIADIQNVVGILVDPLGRKAGDLNFWDQSATDFFTAVILHVLYSKVDENKNLAQVRRLLINIEPTLHAMMHTRHRNRPDYHAADGLARNGEGALVPEIHPEVLLGATALATMDERVKSNVLATCRASLSLWADPLVEYATSWSDFSIGDLVCSDSPVSFYIITPQAHADRLAFLVRVFTRQTINSLMESEHHDSRRRPKKHRLLLLLDEFPKLGSLPFLENAMGEMAGYGITAHLICQSFNDVFSKYGDKTPLFDNMHITATFATSEPNSIEKVTRRAGKALEMRESFSDPRSLFGRAHRSTSQSEQQRYILSEEDVRGLDDRKQFLFVNNTKPILADKIRYYEEPFFRERAGDYFHGVPAVYEQRPGAADLPGPAHIDWKGVRAVQAAPEDFAGVSPPKRRRDGFLGAAGAPAEDLPPSGNLDPNDYLDAQSVGGLRHHHDDDDLSLA